MGSIAKVEWIDDLDGTTPARYSAEFGLDGVLYEIDLSDEHYQNLQEILGPFVAAGRRTGGRLNRARPRPVLDEDAKAIEQPEQPASVPRLGQRRATTTLPVPSFSAVEKPVRTAAAARIRPPTARGPLEARAVRSWARKNGWPDLKARGRLAENIWEAYEARDRR